VRKLAAMHHTEGLLGTVYLDLYQRASGKFPGAAHFTLRCGRRAADGTYQVIMPLHWLRSQGQRGCPCPRLLCQPLGDAGGGGGGGGIVPAAGSWGCPCLPQQAWSAAACMPREAFCWLPLPPLTCAPHPLHCLHCFACFVPGSPPCFSTSLHVFTSQGDPYAGFPLPH
jgi:hypothetical protein